jgi:GGDEF domain-containing protein
VLRGLHNYRRGWLRGTLRRGHLAALGSLVEQAIPDPTQLFEHGLTLLVQQLRVDGAIMSRFGEQGPEPIWWALGEGSKGEPHIGDIVRLLSGKLFEHPGRTLVIKDAQMDSNLVEGPALMNLGVRSSIGTALRQSGQITGMLSIHSRSARQFNRAQIGMVNAMSDLFSRTMEIEALKTELLMTRDALDLTAAVAEDNALESPVTRLPNRHYLDIWLKANLYLARRRGEQMAVVLWRVPLTPEFKKALRMISEALRGEDLLVDMGDETFLLLLPRTEREGAEILLDRMRQFLGAVRMGGTLWNPLHKADRDDLCIRSAMNRARLALQEKLLRRDDQNLTYWDILPLNPEDLAEITRSW